jgi:hypothetical protein
MVAVDAGTHSEHVQVIQCDFKRESVKKWTEVENETISGKKSKGHTLRPTFSITATFS